MPTENKSTDLRDLYIKLNPNGWCDEDLEKDSIGFVDPRTSQDFNSFHAGHQAALEAQQGQGEPIRLTAVATLEEDGDGGLEPNWLLEGGTAELLAGMILLVADNAPHLCDDDGSAQVYTRADPAKALNDLEDAKEACVEIEHTGAPGDVIRGMNNEMVDTRAQLAEAQALLRQANGLISLSVERLPKKHQTIREHAKKFRSRIESALSASAEPSAPVVIDEPVCKGAWQLGTACGKCRRCKENPPT